MMTLEEVWESLRQDPETKATMEEVEKSYKLFKKIENLIVADLEAKLAKNRKWLASNEGFLENQKLKQQLAEYEVIKKKYKTIFLDRFVDAKVEDARIWKEKYDRLKQQLTKERKKVVQEVWEDFERCFESNNLKWEDKMIVGKVCNMINEILDQVKEVSDG